MGLFNFFTEIADSSGGAWLSPYRESPYFTLGTAQLDSTYDRVFLLKNSIIRFLGRPCFILVCEEFGIKRFYYGCDLVREESKVNLLIKRTETWDDKFSSEERFLKNRILSYPISSINGLTEIQSEIEAIMATSKTGAFEEFNSWMGKALDQ